MTTARDHRSRRRTRDEFDFAAWDLALANERIRSGFSFDAVASLQEKLKIARNRLAETLTMSPRTLARRETGGRLTSSESERLYRVGRVFGLAGRVFGGESPAETWIKEPNLSLGGAVPLDLVRTEPGARLVEQVLGRAEYGIPA